MRSYAKRMLKYMKGAERHDCIVLMYLFWLYELNNWTRLMWLNKTIFFNTTGLTDEQLSASFKRLEKAEILSVIDTQKYHIKFRLFLPRLRKRPPLMKSESKYAK